MKLARPRRPDHSETIIALIDVVFFLLVFFMLIGRLDATAPFEVTPPVATTGSDLPAGGATLSVAVDGTLAFDGLPIARDALADRLAREMADNPDLLLRINAHRDAEMRYVLPLIGVADGAGVPDTVLIVTPQAERSPP